MMKNAIILTLAVPFILAGIPSCRNAQVAEESSVRAVVPVTVTSPRTGRMTEYTELVATSAFLSKAVIKSPVTGYVTECLVTPGDKVEKGRTLFTVVTREAMVLQQDSVKSTGITGKVTMKASIGGVVASIDHPQGDFVQEGDPLCTLVVPESLVFLLEVPFEMSRMVRPGGNCRLILPGGKEVTSFVKSVLPVMSESSQTRRVVLKPGTSEDIPENLVAKVRIVTASKNDAVILPKSCLLNDEIMQDFWVMKLISDSMAVKIPVKTGLREADSIEIASPLFGPDDRILTSGNYGLGDTAMVRIISEEK